MSEVTWQPDQPIPPQTPVPAYGARKYVGATATGYDAKREQSQKWQDEDRIVRDMLSDIAPGSWVLDVPVGTGRFIPFYEEKRFQVIGVDASEDMLREAAAKVTIPKIVRLCVGDVRELGRYDKSVDAAVMVRLTRWLTPDDRHRAMTELQRVARKRIVVTARVRNHPFAYPYEDINTSLRGWHIARDEMAGDENYRVIALEPDALA